MVDLIKVAGRNIRFVGNKVILRGKNFSQQEFNQAIVQMNRKLRGQRVTFVSGAGQFQDRVADAFRRIGKSSPTIRRALTSVATARISRLSAEGRAPFLKKFTEVQRAPKESQKAFETRFKQFQKAQEPLIIRASIKAEEQRRQQSITQVERDRIAQRVRTNLEINKQEQVRRQILSKAEIDRIAQKFLSPKDQLIRLLEDRKQTVKRKDVKKLTTLQKVTKTVFDKLREKGFSEGKIANFLSLDPKEIDTQIATRKLPQSIRDKMKFLLRGEREFVLGGLRGVKEEPEKTAIIAVASYFAPATLARLGGAKFIAPILARIPTSVKKKGANAISKFLTTAYLTSAGFSIALTPEGQRFQKTGRIFSTEVLPFKLGTKFGVQGLLRNQIKKELNIELTKIPKNKRAAFEDYMNQAELFGKFEPKAKNIKLNRIESIPNKKAQDAIRKFLTKNKEEVVVGGSVAQTGQVRVQRKLGDMDLYLEGRLNPNQAAKQLAGQLKKAGVKRVSTIRGQVTIEGKKAAEFHDIERVLTNIKQVIPNWQNPRRYIITTPEGIKIQRIGLQARRKLVAAFADPKRFATGKYRKDLKDFKSIADQIFINAELKARGAFFFRKKKIKDIEKIFKRKVRLERVRKPKIEKFKKLKKLIIKPSPKKKVGVGIKKPKKISKKITPARRTQLLKQLKKARAVRARKLKRLKASQRRVKAKKPKRIIPSQPPRKPKKKKRVPPSQPPRKPTKRKPPKPPRPPRIPVRREPPSQPPTKPRKRKIKPPRPPPKPPKIPPTVKPPKPPPIIKLKRKRRRIKKKKPQQAWKVKARPLITPRAKALAKKKGKKPKRPKLIKVSKVPLTKKRAKDLRNYIADTSLARTARISRTSGKPQSPRLKAPPGYARKTRKKFRTHRIVKGKRRPLRSGTVIEKRTKLLDSRQERKGITLRKRISQITPKRKVIKRKPVKRTKPITRPTKKRTPSPAQLKALAAGRRKLARLRKS